MANGEGKRDRDELLEAAGIEVVLNQVDHPVHVACLRAAHRLRRHGARTVGLLPASAEVGVVGIGVNLAIAMAELSGSTVAYVDANARWPALAHLLAQVGQEDTSDVTRGSPFSTRWLRGDVALLVPRRNTRSGLGLSAISRVLASATDLFSCCFVDLTGWKRLGEHLQAFKLLQGIVVVARAGVTTEDQLLRMHHEIPADRHLGVLLTGA